MSKYWNVTFERDCFQFSVFHSTHHDKLMHWLPVTQRIGYKIALMTYSCVYGTSPAYFNGICRPVASVEGHAMLRSANYGELVEPRTKGKRYGPRSFRVAAPFVWNNLPRH